MRQLTQELKSGKMQILEVPFPILGKGQLMVRNHYSVISAGTESKTVKDARLGYIGKARSRQKEVKQVIETVKTSGLIDTYKMVMNKLEAPSALGYSCAGEVIDIGEGVNGFKEGDWVACGGAGAVHAEIVTVPMNLCEKLPKSVKLKEAAFATIAAIAMQGVRQSELHLGENSVVIGLGLIGQLTVQLLNAAGVRVFGIDINAKQVQIADNNSGAVLSFERGRDDLELVIIEQTGGFGTDAVIITAGTTSLDPVELAGRLCRKKGKVIIVGAVPTGFSREHYFKKELDLRMSCSYGPGRYDVEYEDKGRDYPIGYVRWTEKRNMQAYLQLLKDRKIDINPLITHEFEFEKAQDAYQMILEKNEPFLGIVLKYNTTNKIEKSRIEIGHHASPLTPCPLPILSVGLIGAGSFAQNVLLPRMNGLCNMVGMTTARGNNSRYVADKYQFNYCTDNVDHVLNDENINTVFITTRHNLHAEYVKKALKTGKHVFVEKPLCMNLEELSQIQEIYNSQLTNIDSQITINSPPSLMVGFNRRFSKHIKKVNEVFLKDSPKAINIRINAGIVPKEHWVHDPEVGGGRIIGEVCHFIDLAMFIAGSEIISVFANDMYDVKGLCDTVSISLKFSNGSVASISYFSNGNKSVSKEYIEVFCNGQVAIVDDFKKMTIHGKKKTKFNLSCQDKGHKEEVVRFLGAIKNGSKCPVPFQESYLSTLATFAVIGSIRNNTPINPQTIQPEKRIEKY